MSRRLPISMDTARLLWGEPPREIHDSASEEVAPSLEKLSQGTKNQLKKRRPQKGRLTR